MDAVSEALIGLKMDLKIGTHSDHKQPTQCNQALPSAEQLLLRVWEAGQAWTPASILTDSAENGLRGVGVKQTDRHMRSCSGLRSVKGAC